MWVCLKTGYYNPEIRLPGLISIATQGNLLKANEWIWSKQVNVLAANLCCRRKKRADTDRIWVSSVYSYNNMSKTSFPFLFWSELNKLEIKILIPSSCIPAQNAHTPLWRPLHLWSSHHNHVRQTLLSSTWHMRELSPGRSNDLPEGHSFLEAEQDRTSGMPGSKFLTS